MGFPKKIVIFFKPCSLGRLLLIYTPKHTQPFIAKSFMPDSHALLKFKVVQILQTYAVFKRSIIKSSMFEAPLVLALGIHTSNPCKSSCTFQFLYGFLVHLPDHMTTACEPIWRNLLNSYYTNFQEVPRNIYGSESQFILHKWISHISSWAENALVAFPTVSKLKEWNVTFQKNSSWQWQHSTCISTKIPKKFKSS